MPSPPHELQRSTDPHGTESKPIKFCTQEGYGLFLGSESLHVGVGEEGVVKVRVKSRIRGVEIKTCSLGEHDGTDRVGWSGLAGWVRAWFGEVSRLI